MEYIKIKEINEYVTESINPMKTPDEVFEMYSVPTYDTGHPEYLRGDEIASNKMIVRKNDVLLCKINPRINRVWVVKDESEYKNIASSEWIVVRNSYYNPEFLAWYFRNPQFKKLMTSEVTGIGGSLTRAQPKAVAEYPVPVMKRQEQDKIVEVLNMIDGVIKSRQQELEKFDDLIKARFVEMFGDPGTNSKGWEQVTVGDVCSSIVRGPFGSALKKEFFVEPSNKTYKVYEQKHAIKKNATIGTYYVTEEKYQELKRFECVPGDIIMSCSGTMGELYQLPEGCERGIINQALCKFTLNDKMLPVCFLTYMRQTIGNLETKGSGIKNIAAVSYVKEMPINLPPKQIQKEYEFFCKQVEKSKVAVQKALDETQLLFDSLMQKYFG